MATKKDVVTGQEKELSEEELQDVMDQMRSGEGAGFLKQTVKRSDGTEKEMVIWGGYEYDGYDRTLNIFMKQDDLGVFAEIMSEDSINVDDIDDPCKNDVGYQITVDFLDTPMMCIMRMGQGKITQELFVRDDRKSCRSIIDVGTGEFETDKEGGFKLDKDTLEENQFMVYVLAFLGARRYLLKENIVQKLYKMYDESAGVILKVSKAGKISAKIVKGLERPDLPCSVFLLGEQLCRPYIDEMIGLKSNGIRPKYDPKVSEMFNGKNNSAQKAKSKKELANEKVQKTLAGRKKASDSDKKQKEDVEKKLALDAAKDKKEKERQEEEKRKKEEEERLAKEKLDREMEQWEKEKERILAEKERAKKDEESRIQGTLDKNLAEINDKYAKESGIERERLESKKDEIANMELSISNLGFFGVFKKGTMQKNLETLKKELSHIETRMSDLETKKNADIGKEQSNYSNNLEEMRERIEKKYTVPDSPIEVARKKKEQEEKEKEIQKNIEGILSASKGELVKLGKYAGKTIEWLVINKDSSGSMLYAVNNVETRDYHNSNGPKVTWADCAMRNWLNTVFYENAFNEIEKGMISTYDCDNSDERNDGRETFNSSADTKDKVFLLSKSEFRKYLRGANSSYAKCNVGWWLRTACNSGFSWETGGYYVNESGTIKDAYWHFPIETRPCIVIKAR